MCSGVLPPRSPPPCPLSNQSTEPAIRASRPWSGGSRERSEETVGEGHVCTQSRLSSTPAVVKSATDGPLFRASEPRPESLIDEEREKLNAVKRRFSHFLKGVEEREGSRRAALFLFLRMCVHQMKRVRNASENATSRPNASVGLSPSQSYTFLVSSSSLLLFSTLSPSAQEFLFPFESSSCTRG